MRFSLDWLKEFVDSEIASEGAGGRPDGGGSPPGGGCDELARLLTLSGFAVEAIETFSPPSDPVGRPDTVLDIDVTSNRSDAMNHLGLAREIAALLNRPLRAPTVVLTEDGRPATGAASIAIEAGDLCPRYVGRVVTGARVGASPLWLKRRLEAVGIAPKNNVVDASNYVLLEFGQPLHAFDLGRLEGRGVVVRLARAGERLVTVADRTEKRLSEGMLLIAEAGTGGGPGRPAAIAGVMGGFDTAISDQTTEILIESAWFDPLSVRRTARELELHTDASHRFERGADPAMTRFAADRLASLIAELSGGRVLRGAIDVRASGRVPSPPFEPIAPDPPTGQPLPLPLVRHEPPIVLRHERIESLIGIEVEPAEVAPLLAKIGIDAVEGWDPGSGSETTGAELGARAPSGKSGEHDSSRRSGAGGTGTTPSQALTAEGARASSGGRRRGPSASSPHDQPAAWTCHAPSWRWDLTREVDLIEEFARLTGYDRVPETLPEGPGPAAGTSAHELEDRARELLVSFGYTEAITYAMIPASDDALFGPWDASAESAPRQALPGGAGPQPTRPVPPDPRFVIANPLSERWEVMRRSLLPGLARALAFNIAHGRANLRLFEVATIHQRDEQGRPVERRVAAIGASGLAADPAWPTPARVHDLLDLKGAIDALAAGLAGRPPVAWIEAEERAPRTSILPALQGPSSPVEAWRGLSPFQPGQSFRILIDDRPAGRGGRLRPEAEAAVECDRPLLLAELVLEPFASLTTTPRFRPLSRLNPVERDLSFFVPKELLYVEIERAVARAAAGAWPLAATQGSPGDAGAPAFFLLDRFEGGSSPAGRVSYAFRFRFTARTRALTAEEMNAAIEAIATRLTSEIRAEIRSR